MPIASTRTIGSASHLVRLDESGTSSLVYCPGPVTGPSADQVGVHDDVVEVLAGRGVERAAAGDQPQPGITRVAVYHPRRERRLGHFLHPVHREGGGPAVRANHLD